MRYASGHAEQRYIETSDCVVMRDAGQVFSTRLAQLDDPSAG